MMIGQRFDMNVGSRRHLTNIRVIGIYWLNVLVKIEEIGLLNFDRAMR